MTWRSRVMPVSFVLAASIACGSSPTPTSPSGSGSEGLTSFILVGSPSIAAAGQTTQLMAKASFNTNTFKFVNADATWSSGTPAVASVSGGVVTGLTIGTTYQFQARALVQSKFTDWSDPVTFVCG